jgi:hypothetical protein
MTRVPNNSFPYYVPRSKFNTTPKRELSLSPPPPTTAILLTAFGTAEKAGSPNYTIRMEISLCANRGWVTPLPDGARAESGHRGSHAQKRNKDEEILVLRFWERANGECNKANNRKVLSGFLLDGASAV